MWPGRSGEDLGARVGGLRGGGRGSPGESGALGWGRKRGCGWG